MGHQLYLMYVPRRFVVETYAVNGEDLGERNYSTYSEKNVKQNTQELSLEGQRHVKATGHATRHVVSLLRSWPAGNNAVLPLPLGGEALRQTR